MRLIISLILLLAVGCGTYPTIQSAEDNAQKIRDFFADSLESSPNLAPENSFREKCVEHVVALYFIINHPELLEKTRIPKEILEALPQDQLKALKNQPLETILKALHELDPSFYQDTQNAMNKAVTEFKFNSDKLEAIKVPRLGDAWTDFFQKVLTNYFPSLTLEDRKRILAYMIRNLKTNATDNEALLSWVHASGPYFQKYMQLMVDYLEPGNDPKLKQLKEDLEKVKDGLPRIPESDRNAYLQELAEKGFDLEYLDTLGAASVGEAMKVRNRATGREMVVKFRRPGIEKIAAREREFFLEQAKSAQGEALKASFNEIAKQIQEEFDYRIELKRIRQGIKAYESGNSGIKVVRPVEDFPHSERYFAMEYVRGKTFKQLDNTKLHRYTKSILWEKLTVKLMSQSLFAKEGAFFHGDLHQGNIMVTFSPELKLPAETTREEVQKAINGGFIQVVVIDFGNAHSLTQNQRLRLKNIFLAASKISNSARAFLMAMLNKQNVEELALKLDDLFSFENRETLPPIRIGKAMDILLANNIPIPGFLMAFKRTLAMLCKIHEDLIDEPSIDLGKPSLDNVLQRGYTDNLVDTMLSDKTPAGLENFYAVINGIALGSVSRTVFEALFIPWSKEYFTYKELTEEQKNSKSCWESTDNYFEGIWSCAGSGVHGAHEWLRSTSPSTVGGVEYILRTAGSAIRTGLADTLAGF